jgi:hypothetical protein
LKDPRKGRKRSKRLSSSTDRRIENHDQLDEVVVRLPCYEPSGTTIDLTLRDLLRHVILVGQSGSGKTTLMNKMWSDLIAYRAPGGQRMGLLILDSQGDHTVAGVRHLAEKAGRSEDVVVLSPHEGSYNPLAELKSFSDVETAVAKIISSTAFSNRSGGDNDRDVYWVENTRGLIESAFIYLLVEGRSIGVIESLQFVSELFLGTGLSATTKEVVAKCDKIMAEARHLSAGARAKLVFAQLNLAGWDKLDSRTRSILQSCLRITLAPFLTTSALSYWNATKGPAVDPGLALQGRIVVISTQAAIEPETAQIICRLAKMDFYGAAQRRASLGENPVAGLVMDEFHYSALQGSSRWSDISNLATLRGRGVFVLAATQGLVQLDLLLGGPVATEALMINFGSHVFLRSVEIGHLYRLAERILGQKPGRTSNPPGPFTVGDVMTANTASVIPSEPVCPRGKLAQLDTHQAFVALASGFKTMEPVWLAPLYLPEFASTEVSSIDADISALRSAQSALEIVVEKTEPALLYPVSLWDFLIKTSPRFSAAFGLMTAEEFRTALRSLGREATGIDTIPPVWRLACFHLARRLPPNLSLVHLAAEEGQLQVEFMAWSGGIKLAALLARQKRWRGSVYPSVLRPLRLSDHRWLRIHFPHVYSQADLTRQIKKV